MSLTGLIPFTYDGVDWQYANLGIVLQITVGLNDSPEVRGSDYIVPTLAGRIPRNRVGDRLRILLEGWVQADADGSTGRENYRTYVDFIRQYFDPTRAETALVVTLEDGSTRSISARPINTEWDHKIPSQFSYVSIELESVDPDWSDAGS